MTKGRIQAGKDKTDSPMGSGRIHKQRSQPDNLLRFSFRHFTTTDKFSCPEDLTYLAALFDRMKDVSNWTVSEFRQARKALRNHQIHWSDTSEPSGFSHLNDQLKECEAWQFCITSNAYGRVHGLLIDEVFYVVWLDEKHQLYPSKK